MQIQNKVREETCSSRSHTYHGFVPIFLKRGGEVDPSSRELHVTSLDAKRWAARKMQPRPEASIEPTNPVLRAGSAADQKRAKHRRSLCRPPHNRLFVFSFAWVSGWQIASLCCSLQQRAASTSATWLAWLIAQNFGFLLNASLNLHGLVSHSIASSEILLQSGVWKRNG